MRLKSGRMVLIAVAALVSALLIALAFFRFDVVDGSPRLSARFDFGDWFARLPSHLPWVIPFVVLTGSLSVFRAMVWGRTLPGVEAGFRPLPWRVRFHAVALGGLIHNAAPGHLGPLASAWVLSRHGGPPLAASLASLLLAKLLEFGALCGAMVLLALGAHARGVGGVPARPVLIAGFVALAVFVAAMASARRLAPPLAARLDARGRLPRVSATLRALASGLVAVGRPRHLGAGWSLALGPVLASSLAYGLALRHAGCEEFLLGGGILLGALTLAQMTPGLPSGVGIYYFVCTATARAMGVADEPAAAVAVLSHAATAVTHILVGLVSAAVHHEALRDLRSLRATVATAAPAPPATT